MNKIILLTTIITSSIVLASTPPTTGDILREVQPKKIQKDLRDLPSLKVKKFKAPIAENKGLKVFVKSFKIEGNSTYRNQHLLSLLYEYKNKELTISQLKKVASIITKYYRDNGYFVARAYIPAQELDKKNAIIEIVVIEGLYGNFSIENSSLLDNLTAQGYMDRIKDSKVISISSLERQLILLDELKGAEVTDTRILSGKEIGKSDFTVTLKEEPLYNGYVIADNYGSEYTGRYRLNILGFLNSLNKKGDIFGISTLVSNTTALKNIRLSYDTPVAYDGLTLNFSLSKTKYKVGKEFDSQDIHGDSLNFITGLSYPLIKQRAHTLSTSLSYSYNDIADYDISQDKKKSFHSITLALDDTRTTSLFQKEGLLNTTLSFTKGKLSLDSPDAKAHDTILQAAGNYEKINFSISQTQFIIPNISIVAKLKAQKSFGKNLDGIENISISGALGARAYDNAEASGDNGYFTSLELFYLLSNYKNTTHTISTFIDHGKVWLDENKTTELNNRVLNSIGLGYNLSYKNFSLETTYARSFNEDKIIISDTDKSTQNRFFVQLISRF